MYYYPVTWCHQYLSKAAINGQWLQDENSADNLAQIASKCELQGIIQVYKRFWSVYFPHEDVCWHLRLDHSLVLSATEQDLEIRCWTFASTGLCPAFYKQRNSVGAAPYTNVYTTTWVSINLKPIRNFVRVWKLVRPCFCAKYTSPQPKQTLFSTDVVVICVLSVLSVEC